MSKNSISETIRKYRIMKGYSQTQLASELGIAASAIGAYESGTRIPKVELRTEIARKLNVDPVELSGIELTNIDEQRLLNKLLIKYCIEMKETEYKKNGTTCEGVSVILPYDFVPLKEEFNAYLDAKTSEISKINLLNICSPIEEDKLLYDNDRESEIRAELEYWVDTWPQYDYLYQAKFNKNGTLNTHRHTLKEWLHAKFITSFIDFKNKFMN